MASVKLHLEDNETLLDRLAKDGIDIAHDCGGKQACSSCLVVVREGLERLEVASEDELDMLDVAGAAAPGARLACQVNGGGELTVDIPRSTPPMRATLRPISVSERAAKHLTAQLAKHPVAVGVRVSVKPAGCSGFRYRVDPTESVRNDDRVFESGGVRIVVDAASLPYLEGTALDVVDEGLFRRLHFANPNVQQSCGCGESFSV